MTEIIQKVEQWFIDRNLHTLTSEGQLVKLQEEVDELKDAFSAKNKDEQIDAVGDITVVLIGYCMQNGLNFEECLNAAYEQIKDRKGQVIDGIFVKEK